MVSPHNIHYVVKEGETTRIETIIVDDGTLKNGYLQYQQKCEKGLIRKKRYLDVVRRKEK